MSSVRRVAKNTSVFYAAQMIAYLIAFIYFTYVARYLGVAEFGVLSFGLAFTGIFSFISDLGLSQLTAREVARDHSLAHKFLSNTIPLRLVLAVITAILVAVSVNALGYPTDVKVIVYVLTLYAVMTTFAQAFTSVFQGFQRLEYQAVGILLTSVLMFGGIIFGILQGFDALEFAIVYALVSITIVIYYVIVCFSRFLPVTVEVDRTFWSSVVKEAWPFGVTGIFMTIYYYIDTVMLSLLSVNADEVIGWYNAAYRLVFTLLFIRTALHTALFPLMSQYYETSKELLRFTCERLFKYSFVIGLPLAILTTLFAYQIIYLVFGAAYLPATIALQVLIWSDVIIFVNFTPSLFESTNRQIVFTKITCIGAVANVALNLVLIPQFSYVGSSLATVFTEFIVLIISFRMFSLTPYAFGSAFAVRTTSKVLLAGLCMIAIIIALRSINDIGAAALSIVGYVGVLYLTRAYDSEDIALFTNLVKTQRRS